MSDSDHRSLVGWVEWHPKWRCLGTNTPEIRPVLVSTQKRSETQLYTISLLESSNQSVGFYSVSGGCNVSGESHVSL